MKCPCCGGEIEDVNVEQLLDARLSAVEMTVVRRIVGAYPNGVSLDQLITEIYGMRNDQPDNAANCVQVVLNRLRRKIAEYGWTVPKGTGGRATRHTYRLERLQ